MKQTNKTDFKTYAKKHKHVNNYL